MCGVGNVSLCVDHGQVSEGVGTKKRACKETHRHKHMQLHLVQEPLHDPHSAHTCLSFAYRLSNSCSPSDNRLGGTPDKRAGGEGAQRSK